VDVEHRAIAADVQQRAGAVLVGDDQCQLAAQQRGRLVHPADQADPGTDPVGHRHRAEVGGVHQHRQVARLGPDRGDDRAVLGQHEHHRTVRIGAVQVDLLGGTRRTHPQARRQPHDGPGPFRRRRDRHVVHLHLGKACLS
jgi:hypothetical protein